MKQDTYSHISYILHNIAHKCAIVPASKLKINHWGSRPPFFISTALRTRRSAGDKTPIKEDKIMPLTINTNASASAANFHLSRNQSALHKSLTRLSSGSRITQPIDDAGGLAVSMKFESAIVRLSGAQKNVQNATSYLEVQDGILSSAGKILNRMIELKGLSDDVMKNSSDIQNYNREFRDLQQQIYDMANLKFNGVSMFATTATNGNAAVFNNLSQNLQLDNTVSVYAQCGRYTGPIVSVNKALLLSAPYHRRLQRRDLHKLHQWSKHNLCRRRFAVHDLCCRRCEQNDRPYGYIRWGFYPGHSELGHAESRQCRIRIQVALCGR